MTSLSCIASISGASSQSSRALFASFCGNPHFVKFSYHRLVSCFFFFVLFLLFFSVFVFQFYVLCEEDNSQLEVGLEEDVLVVLVFWIKKMYQMFVCFLLLHVEQQNVKKLNLDQWLFFFLHLIFLISRFLADIG